MFPVRKLMLTAAFPLVLAACDDDVVTPEEGLTETEAVALLKKTGGLLFEVEEPTFTSEDSVVVACPQGGSATAVGALPDEEFSADTARLVVDYRITPSACQVTSGAMRFTVDGDPSFRYQFAIEFIASTGEYDIAGSISGGVKWQLEDRSGSCAMELTLVGPQVVDEEVLGSFEGRLCGHDVEVDATGLVPPADV